MKYVIGNWKANHDLNSCRSFLMEWQALLSEEKIGSEVIVSIAPPTVLYPIFLAKAKEQNIPILTALQNISSCEEGPYTGEVILDNLQDMEPSMIIVGHSERRSCFGETDKGVAIKVDKMLEKQIVPVVCVDEPYLHSQAKMIPKEHHSKLIIAYEPLSAIGTGENMSPDKVEKVVEKIKKTFESAKVLYGGSVTADNVVEYLQICDGVLVGSASLEAGSFYKIAKQAGKI